MNQINNNNIHKKKQYFILQKPSWQIEKKSYKNKFIFLKQKKTFPVESLNLRV